MFFFERYYGLVKKIIKDAVSFNRPLNAWNVSNVTSFSEMVMNASCFEQTLPDRKIAVKAKKTRMFSGAVKFNQV